MFNILKFQVFICELSITSASAVFMRYLPIRQMQILLMLLSNNKFDVVVKKLAYVLPNELAMHPIFY